MNEGRHPSGGEENYGEMMTPKLPKELKKVDSLTTIPTPLNTQMVMTEDNILPNSQQSYLHPVQQADPEVDQSIPNAENEPDHKQEEQEEDQADGLMHGINSFWAVVTPVAVTMLLASFVVVNYRSAGLEQSMGSYLVFKESDESTGGEVFGQSIVNALVIIGAVAGLTFVMVICYKYNCMKFLMGYIMFASAAILGFQGGQLMDEVLNDHFEWPVDWISFVFIMFNFGIVGVIAIFYQKGISKIFQNGYLVLVSVLLAWQFSMWPEWTTWIFCSMFAVYDLCAVLTPCGPLKCLIGLIQEKQAPLPGLLYEAEVRDGVGNSTSSNNKAKKIKEKISSRKQSSATTSNDDTGSQDEGHLLPPHTTENTARDHSAELHAVKVPNYVAPEIPRVHDSLDDFESELRHFYEFYSPEDAWKSSQAAERFFEKQESMWPLLFHKYAVCSCKNASENTPCQVQIEKIIRYQKRLEEEEDEEQTIKLGLGDFIFYSVLVGRAAMHDFTTLAVSFLCIILGLGGTLFLLSVLHKALPALPISIFLATFFYFMTRLLFEDFANFITAFPAAV